MKIIMLWLWKRLNTLTLVQSDHGQVCCHHGHQHISQSTSQPTRLLSPHLSKPLMQACYMHQSSDDFSLYLHPMWFRVKSLQHSNFVIPHLYLDLSTEIRIDISNFSVFSDVCQTSQALFNLYLYSPNRGLDWPLIFPPKLIPSRVVHTSVYDNVVHLWCVSFLMPHTQSLIK